MERIDLSLKKALVSMIINSDDQDTKIEVAESFKRDTASARGYQLDEIGNILGLKRFPGETDPSYRERLDAKIRPKLIA